MEKIINKIIKYLTIMFGLLIIIYIFYNLFLRYMFPLNINFSYLRYLILLSFILQLITLCRNININFITTLTKIKLKFIENFYWKPLNSIFDLIKKIPGNGDFFYSTSKIFIRLGNIGGKNSMLISCVVLYLIPNILIIYIFFTIIFMTKKVPLYFLILLPLSFIVLRLTKLLIYILNDFAEQNKKAIEPYIIITKLSPTRTKYELNLDRVKKPSKEKIELYAERYKTFCDTLMFTQSFLNYKNKRMNPIITPFLIATGFMFTLYLLCKLFIFPYNKISLLICFLVVFLIEFLNEFLFDKKK